MPNTPFDIKDLEKQLQKITSGNTELVKLTIRLNDELKTKNLELQDIIESLPQGLIATDTQGVIVHFNKTISEFTKIASKDAQGKKINNLFGMQIIPDNLISLQRKGEKTHLVSKQFAYANKNQIEQKLEYTLVPLQTTAGFIVHIENITLVEKLKQEAERKNRLTIMGKMAASIAHEIRNPLTSIDLFSSMLAKEFKEDSENLETVSYIQQSVKTANYVISNLLQYTKPLQVNKKQINLQKLLQKFCKMNQPLARQQKYELLIEEQQLQNPFIEGDQELLIQVFNNIFNNALQALQTSKPQMGHKKNSIIITIQNKHLSQKDKTTLHNEELIVSIQDWGCGMSEATKKQIFTPFYTTKDKGIGLGMSITKNILDEHQAEIWIESTENKPTTVFLKFNQNPS